MLSLPAKRVCKFTLPRRHILFIYAHVSDLRPPLILKPALNGQSRSILACQQHAQTFGFAAILCWVL